MKCLTKLKGKNNQKAYVLRIRGYGWELDEGLSTHGKQNLKDALKLMNEIV